MISLPSAVQVWLACGHTDMRKGLDGLASLARNQPGKDPFSGQLFVFRKRSVNPTLFHGWAHDPLTP